MATNIIRRNVSYLNRDFNEIRNRLINYSKSYFPNTYTDFSPTSPGMMFMEQIAYAGDVLSFYLDNQVQETYLQYTRQSNNLFEMAYMFGYKPKITGLASTDIDFYQQLPAKIVNGQAIPDYDYALYIPQNTTVSARKGANFIIEDPVDFTVSGSQDPTSITIAQVSGGEPQYYLLRKSRRALSGNIFTKTFNVGAYEEFPTLEIDGDTIAEIIDITDSEGNKYYEVDYLAQELVFLNIKNTNINDPNNYQKAGEVPYILNTLKTQYRFITRYLNQTTLQIQFGSGNPEDTTEDIIPNPDNVGLGLPFKKDKLTTAYSPTNFIFTNTYGVAPSNTSLTVRYLAGGGVGSNVEANTLITPSTPGVRFLKNNLNTNTANYIFNSIASNNPLAATGGSNGDTTTEIRQNTLAQSNTQLRAVTADDYLIRALSMPGKYGDIAKAFITKPSATNLDNSILDLYILAYDQRRKLTKSSTPLKQNIKTYINNYKTIGDNINIKDAFIINIGCEFEIVSRPDVNNNVVLENCIFSLKQFFLIDRFQINSPIMLRDIQVLLDSIDGVQSVKSVKITNKVGENLGYSQYAYDIEGATQNQIIYPSLDPMVFEIKFPNQDIKGRVVNL
jgi:hypothetical protein|tara:strand:- start:6736 stop:8586 length:1851 start_codon:yes stop_codon:yes gene_type:complete